MNRTAHYVVSTHWDREWYEPLQGYRMRLVSLLDEVLDTLQKSPDYKTFYLDGQFIPLTDYLEIRPERSELFHQFVRQGRVKVGPWFVLPDEWVISAESFVRNLQLGMKLATGAGATVSRTGFVCDQFGHISQLPQIFNQLGLGMAFLWRGLSEAEYAGHVNWQGADGTVLPTYRFGRNGYCSFGFDVRLVHKLDEPFDIHAGADRLVQFTLLEAGRSDLGPILLFDGPDHMEIEPQMPETIRLANAKLAAHGIQIVHSDLDAYMTDALKVKDRIKKSIKGELRETGKPIWSQEEVWAIPGILASRLDIKHANAKCEDELALLAEPFSTFASLKLGSEYPREYLNVAWKWLLENHPHDSMGGCSIDQVHQDMVYRFDQSIGISSRLTQQATRKLALAGGIKDRSKGALTVTVFNHTAEEIDEPVDLDLPLPLDFPTFREWENTEEKFGFRIKTPTGEIVPYQRVAQQRAKLGFKRLRCKFPQPDERHVVTVTARVKVPAFGYATLVVEPQPTGTATRHLGTLATSHRSIENEHLTVTANLNGTITLVDKRSGRIYSDLLTFEDSAEAGDGWTNYAPVANQVFASTASPAEVAIVHDGIGKATLRIAVKFDLPAELDFRTMTRSERRVTMRVVSDVTLRAGVDRVEVKTVVDNNALDHRLRVLFPTTLTGETYLSDSVFDVVERPVKLPADNETRRELDVEARPQISWTAFGDGKAGLAVVSRGQHETAVTDTPHRTIAMTLIRAFRRTIFAGEQTGGQVQGSREFRYFIVPFSGHTPVKSLFLLGQRSLMPTLRQVPLTEWDYTTAKDPIGTLPPSASFLALRGNAVITSVQNSESGRCTVRLFNPNTKAEKVALTAASKASIAKAVNLEGLIDTQVNVKVAADGSIDFTLPPKRFTTIVID